MNYTDLIRDADHEPEQLETLYQSAVQADQAPAFADAIERYYAEAPDNLLYAAWHYRFVAQVKTQLSEPSAQWWLAIPLSILSGLLFWWLSDDKQFAVHKLPLLFFLAGPISACFVTAFFSFALRVYPKRLFLLGLGLLGFVIYVVQAAELLNNRVRQDDYLYIALLHLPLLAWGAVGVYLLWQKGEPEERFAFLIKSIEVIVTGGLFAAAGGIFTGVAFGMFRALGIELSELVVRLFIAGGAGLLPVLAVATVYRPEVSPLMQAFGQGLGKLIFTVTRLLLPLTLLVLIVYVALIPFNFMQPFHNRDVLIVYNAMLFGVMALLVGATPVRDSELSPRLSLYLRRALFALVLLALVVGFYAMAAILYRTWQGGFTPNRVMVIGWNVVNIALLLILLAQQWQVQPGKWLAALRNTVSLGTKLYMAWAMGVVLLLPWLF
ncbi:MAG: hypothetical protein U0350_43805 [Caldilineaceae bacterium]